MNLRKINTNSVVKPPGTPTLNTCKDFPDYFAERTGAVYFKCRPYTSKIEARAFSNLSDCNKKYL